MINTGTGGKSGTQVIGRVWQSVYTFSTTESAQLKHFEVYTSEMIIVSRLIICE